MPPPSPPPPHAETESSKVRVVDVWAHNQEKEQAVIRALVRLGFPIVAVATSHDIPARPQLSPTSASAPATLDDRYEAVRARVEGVRFAQVGVALASPDGGGGLALGYVWRFHLGDGVDAEDARFLAAVGVDPPALAQRADPGRLCRALRAWCAQDAMYYGALVTRDGAEDVAYIAKHIRGGHLPARRDEFLRECSAAFPALYDLKVLEEWATLTRAGPPLAAAGRDAFRGFLALFRKEKAGILKYYNAFLSGVGAADTWDLMSFKKTMAEEEENLRQMKELFRKLCPGQDPAYLDNLPLC